MRVVLLFGAAPELSSALWVRLLTIQALTLLLYNSPEKMEASRGCVRAHVCMQPFAAVAA